MFRELPAFAPYDAALEALADSMADTPPGPAGDNPDIPSGYTYLGQFVDHDITFDPVSGLDRVNDPDALNTFRTPRFDLDSLYGRGQADTPYLYDQHHPASLLVGRNPNAVEHEPVDLLRESEVVREGRGLGPTGGRMVAEVLVGLLKGDPSSFLRQAPAWKPELPAATPGTFTMAGLLRFAGVA